MNFREVSKFRLPQKMDQQCRSISSRFLLNGKCNITELSTGLIPLHKKYEEKKKRQKTRKKEGHMQKIDFLEVFESEFAKTTSGKCITSES